MEQTTLLSFAIAKTLTKEDRRRNSSQWRWSELKAKLPDFPVLEKKWQPPSSPISDALMEKVLERCKEALIVTFGSDLSDIKNTALFQFQDVEREEQCRIAISALVLPIAASCKKKVLLEKRYAQGLYPVSRIDYEIDNGAGVIEASINSRMTKDKVAQLLLTMLSLGKKKCWAALTDGYCWNFFKAEEKCIKMSKTYFLKTWDDVRLVCSIFFALMK